MTMKQEEVLSCREAMDYCKWWEDMYLMSKLQENIIGFRILVAKGHTFELLEQLLHLNTQMRDLSLKSWKELNVIFDGEAGQ